MVGIAKLFGATDRAIRRWLSVHRLGNRRLKPDSELLVSEVIDDWAARAERLPVSGNVE
jgi:hypothetical protein